MGLFRAGPIHHAALSQSLWGLEFPNPVGLAAGFDKDAKVPIKALNLGFGFVELGSVTPNLSEGISSSSLSFVV